ncbi:hypothetical protein B0T26DRAFT_690802 [Lasiosphaeria miniovina]|uniref:Uncharacterized protein n=1 Tax=Lasiosphaeria miniovina TaxID=1954250 RepID=A0AA40BIZ3_9PEZI|nr:uncharacterized protein B0T26DRAFT_690802 [Lasiosphaeria miniovina]KAK0735090.1 hypothetical protein B0T26DRAFT_690802 [Lasiosphaeria miniovina]
MTTTAPAVPALTTTFAPPESCLVSYSQYTYSGSTLTCYADDNSQIPCVFMHLGPATGSPVSACLPPSYTPTASFYYSPGICPSGYQLACSSTSGAETRGTCCPSSYGCMTPSTWWPWYSTDLCTIYMAPTVSFVYAASTVGVGWQINTGSAAAANAFGIPIRFKAADLASSTSSAATSTSSPSPSSSPLPSRQTSGSSAPEATALPAVASPSSELSAGAKAGIAIGAALAAIILIASAIFVWLRRRRAAAAAGDATAPEKVETQYYQGAQFGHVWRPSEMDTPSTRTELGGDGPPVAELRGDGWGRDVAEMQ